MTSKRSVASIAAVTAAAAALMLGILATQASAALKHFDGTVASKNTSAKTFKITTQSGRQVTFKVNASTVFERISGFGALHKGMSIQVNANQTANGLIAKKVEPQEGGGGGNGGGGGGADDGPNHH